MMKHLNKEYHKRISNIDKSMDLVYNKLQHLKNASNFKEQEDKVKNDLDVFDRDTLVIKEKTFWRDKRAFQEGKAYR